MPTKPVPSSTVSPAHPDLRAEAEQAPRSLLSRVSFESVTDDVERSRRSLDSMTSVAEPGRIAEATRRRQRPPLTPCMPWRAAAGRAVGRPQRFRPALRRRVRSHKPSGVGEHHRAGAGAGLPTRVSSRRHGAGRSTGERSTGPARPVTTARPRCSTPSDDAPPPIPPNRPEFPMSG